MILDQDNAGSSPVSSIMNFNKSFVDSYLCGEAALDDVDDFIDFWHDNYLDGKSLIEYLGLTNEEYFDWIESERSLYDILSHKRNQ